MNDSPSLKPWLTQYPVGCPVEVEVPADTLIDVLERACREYGGRKAYLCLGGHLDYRGLEESSRHFAAWLQHAGLKPDGRVAIMMPNLLQYPVVLFGTLRAGGVVVNCNPLYTPRELEFQLRDAGVEVLVVLENFAHTVAQIDVPSLRQVVVTTIGDLLGPRGCLVNFVVRHVKKAVPSWRLPGHLGFREVLRIGREKTFSPVPRQNSDLAFFQYTGGTTGRSKGAMLTHRNLVANLTQVEAWLKSVVEPGRELVVTALPLYHIFALTANCLTFLKYGATNLLIPNPRDMDGFVSTLKRHHFTIMTGVNTLFSGLMHHPRIGEVDFSGLKATLGGGMAVQKEIAERWRQTTGNHLSQAYGLTETSPAATINPLGLEEFNGSIGLPIPSTELEIRDGLGKTLALGEIGEICIRGPQVMKGYWQQPVDTAAVFYPDGFLMTGDIGRIDEKGFVYLLDRKKDLIKVSGFNVYPNEIEEVMSHCPGVREVAAIGVGDEHSGQAIKLFVVRSDPALTTEKVIDYCRHELTGYKIPRHVEFRTELPHSNVGKVLRRVLKDGG